MSLGPFKDRYMCVLEDNILTTRYGVWLHFRRARVGICVYAAVCKIQASECCVESLPFVVEDKRSRFLQGEKFPVQLPLDHTLALDLELHCKTKTICISCHVYTVNYFVCIPITRIANQVDDKLSLVVYNNQPMSSSPVTSWRYLLRFYPAGHETNALRLGRLFPPCNICYS